MTALQIAGMVYLLIFIGLLMLMIESAKVSTDKQNILDARHFMLALLWPAVFVIAVFITLLDLFGLVPVEEDNTPKSGEKND